MNRWKDFVLGCVGGMAGTVAMGRYWKAATALTGEHPRTQTRGKGPQAIDDISLIGSHHEPGESSTAALGRIAYQGVAGKPPQAVQTKTLLSYLVHYGYDTLQGGLFGTLSGDRGRPTMADGLGFGTALWLLGDELAVSLLGLADRPGRYPIAQHLHRWGAPLTHGMTTAGAVRALRRLL